MNKLKRTFIFWSVFACLAAGTIQAHEYAIYPVFIDLKIYEKHIEAKLESNAGYWYGKILKVPFGTELSGVNWPAPIKKAARTYIAKSFELKLEGQPLVFEQFNCRYIQEPLRPSSSEIVCEWIYPISESETSLRDQILTGRSQFFAEYKKHRAQEKATNTQSEEYVTELKVIGTQKKQITIPFDQPQFSVPLKKMVRTKFQKTGDALKSFILRAINQPLVIIVIAIGIFLLIRRAMAWKK